MNAQKAIVLFDGLCALCEKTVPFTVKNDPKKNLELAALQSPVGQKLLAKFGLPLSDFKSIVFIENGRAYTRSTAALKYLKKLRRPWSLLYALRAIPAPLRDPLYDWVSQNRYRWFGKRAECWGGST